MSSTDKSAPGIVCDSQPASEMCRDVALEDWDILFDAVVHRLGSTFDELPSGDVVVLRQKWVQARTCVLDCVQALNQLQVTAAHEIARQQHKDAVGWPFTLRPGSKGATADHQKLQADVLRAIWQVWNDNLRVPNGTPPST